jgi:hypothetical protein
MSILEQGATMPPQGFAGDLNPLLEQCLSCLIGGLRRPQHIRKARLIFHKLMNGIKSDANCLSVVWMGLKRMLFGR